jgi:putative FmdB family regulatory protein
MPIYDVFCEKCGNVLEDVWMKHNEECGNCPKCGHRLKRVCAAKSFELKYNNKTDMCDWAGNTSQYWKDYKKAKEEGKKVKPAGED